MISLDTGYLELDEKPQPASRPCGDAEHARPTLLGRLFKSWQRRHAAREGQLAGQQRVGLDESAWRDYAREFQEV
jgi:hypothetical protein